MLRAGMILSNQSGIYEWLPMGLKVLQNVSRIAQEEMNKGESRGVITICSKTYYLCAAKVSVDTAPSDEATEMLLMSDRHDNSNLSLHQF